MVLLFNALDPWRWLAWLIWNYYLQTNVSFNLVVLIKLCKIWYLSLDRPLLFPRNQVFCLENWKLRRASTTIEFHIFCWNFAHIFYLVMSRKGYVGFFLFCLDLELLIKSVKSQCVGTRLFLIFANNSRSKWAHQSFQIFKQNTWFLKNNRALSKFLYGILHYLISIIKL